MNRSLLIVEVQDVRQGSLCPDLALVYARCRRGRGVEQAAQLRLQQCVVVLFLSLRRVEQQDSRALDHVNFRAIERTRGLRLVTVLC